MPYFRDGQVNTLSLTNPGVYVDQILPQPFITGVPTNIEGLVGVGQWGPLNSPQFFSSPDDCAGIYGIPVVRAYDLPTYVQTGVKMGGTIGFCGVRVSDGSDTAATATVANQGGTFVARYSGTRGNKISFTFQNTTAAGAYAAIVGFPGRTPERFDNLQQALAALTVAPGTGYTSVPSLSLSAPTGIGAVPASAQASLATVGAPTLGSGGTGHAVNDVLTLPNGLTIKVLSVTGGAIQTFSVVNAGSLATGAVPANPVAMTSSTGAGTGATFNLTWGLGPATFTSGYGYSAPLTVTMTGGGAGTGGSYTPVMSFWAALAYAINNGTPQRGRSKCVVFSAGTGTGAPTLNAPATLTGGTDGASGVGTAQMIGIDIRPRTGMYALRASGCADFALCDLVDPTTWSTQVSFSISEAMFPVTTTAASDTILGAIATRTANGVDDPSLWILEGDWPTVYDDQNGITRLVSPQAIGIALLGNLSPEQSPINKPLIPVIATQTSQQGILVADADETQAQLGGIDLIGQSVDLGATYFSFLTGRNASSNSAANGVEYTRLTYFLMRSFNGPAARAIIGNLQSIRADDPTRTKANDVLNSFLSDLASPEAGSNGYGMIDSFSVQCDLNNNPPTLQARGFLFAFVKVRYLNVVRYFVIQLAGGGNVSTTVQSTAPTVAQLVAQYTN